ncbi:DUF6478 family protein [Aliiruegeria lutimaris]|uniref:Uncharacterized protein n=1 Tax=Aliiruegeria lutimaris TaxID=571298 RepID=A0A1G8VXM2_9RHOB|nr:DUF6478 family protein [Aliiruegeria lutimaris]SDJ69990.1 hypothetical protein SAMN04488026_102251 [Aliiruegeria lutimaris]
MSMGVSNLIGRVADRRVLQRWTRLADIAGNLDFSELKSARARANDLRREIDRLCRAADGRMAEVGPAGSVVEAPANADWSWRPDFWRIAADPPGVAGVASGTVVGPGVAMFHDCPLQEITFRQLRNRGATDLAPFGLNMDVFRFEGSFLSLAVDLPREAVAGLTRRHLIGLHAAFRFERPLEIFARLNIRNGPNTDQLVLEIAKGSKERNVEFDLAYSELNEKRIESAWLDLIFEAPQMSQIEIRDLTMYRRHRTEI